MTRTQTKSGRRRAVAWLRRFAATTPGLIGGVGLVLVIACVVTAIVGAAQLNNKKAERTHVLETTEPLAFAAQNLYAALSTADSTAAAAFLSGGIEAPQVRSKYQQALADAATALAAATSGSGDDETRNAVAQIAAGLPAYTGLIESARANNRQGFPVGAAYLREASALMQTSLLPNAEKLYAAKFADLTRSQGDIAAYPGITVFLLLLTLAGLAAASVLLLRRTNRRYNTGLVLAAIATVIALLWITIAMSLVSNSIDASRADGSTKFDQLAEARILAQQARTDETLELITRGDIGPIEASYNDHIGKLREKLESSGADADGFSTWTDGHRKQVEAYLSANYAGAVRQAIGSEPEGSTEAFSKLDSSIQDEIHHARTDLRDRIDAAGSRLTLSPTAILVLLGVTGVATIAGLWPRLKEFL